jgi:hemolysin III
MLAPWLHAAGLGGGRLVSEKGPRTVRALREPANALTHLVGSLFSLVALVILVRLGLGTGNGRVLVSLSIYGLSQLALYTASTLYHGLRLTPVAMEWLLRLDCTLVFVFIAGTYTPVCLIALQHGWRWGLLGVVWGIALGGLVLKLLWLHSPIWLSTTLYVAMGWVALAALPALVRAIPRAGIVWFTIGGIIYTIGALIFLLDRPWPRAGAFEAHAVWHLCVVAGSCCCFWATVCYIAPLA